MTDDSTSIPTVGDDEIGSLEDREVRPLSSTNKGRPVNRAAFSMSKHAPCPLPAGAAWRD